MEMHYIPHVCCECIFYSLSARFKSELRGPQLILVHRRKRKKTAKLYDKSLFKDQSKPAFDVYRGKTWFAIAPVKQ